MADKRIALELTAEEAEALCHLLRNLRYEEITRKSKRIQVFKSGRHPADVAWSALRNLEHQLAQAGVCEEANFSEWNPE